MVFNVGSVGGPAAPALGTERPDGLEEQLRGVPRLRLVGPPPEAPDACAAQVVAVREAERQRIARDLHDVVGQALTAVRLSLVSIDRVNAVTGASGRAIDDSIATVDTALEQVRTLAYDLRPPVLDDFGLAAALRSSCRGMARRAGLAVSFRDRTAGLRFAPDVEAACFRVAQEALTNVARHARARRVTVVLRIERRGRCLVLEVRDDGRGLDPAVLADGRRAGIAGMRERAKLVGGDLEIRSARGEGTRVIARLPLAADLVAKPA